MRATERRPLGRTGLEVSALGLGTAPLGNLFAPVPDDEAAATVRRAVRIGLGYVDTAPYYGYGLAERRVGAVLSAMHRDGFAISTKVGRLVRPTASGGSEYAVESSLGAVFDFTGDGILRSVEESLARLGLDRVDILYIHDPDEFVEQALAEAYPALHQLRADGTVRAIGVGMNQSAVPTRFVHETDIDVVLLAGRYTLLDRSGLADLLPACVERGVSVVIGGVYNSGILADPRPGTHYDYAVASEDVLARARRLDEICRGHGVPLKAAAIQFPFRHPAVASVLTGARSVAELEENVAMFEHPVPDALWAELA